MTNSTDLDVSAVILELGGWLVALDNVSHLQPWLSDALCRISTGGALSTRQLYTDGDEHIVEAVRPILITGITTVITRGDLQDRTIAITLPAIPDHRRRPEADLWAAYDQRRPALARLLKDFRIHPAKIRFGADTLNGYTRRMFEDAWTRYTPPQPERRNIANNDGLETPVSQPEHPESCSSCKNAISPNNDGLCSGVPVQTPDDGHETEDADGDGAAPLYPQEDVDERF